MKIKLCHVYPHAVIMMTVDCTGIDELKKEILYWAVTGGIIPGKYYINEMRHKI